MKDKQPNVNVNETVNETEKENETETEKEKGYKGFRVLAYAENTVCFFLDMYTGV